MSVYPSTAPVSDISPVPPTKAVRTPAAGPCRCSRRTCWHAHDCRASGIVRILRAPKVEGGPSASVVLCRECAAPTRRQRVA